MSHRACQNVLSVETHRRAATGNTKSREVAGALAGTAPSSTARNPGTRRGLIRRRACHLTYTRSGRCEHACNDLPAYTNTWKHKSEPWSAPRDDSCIGFKEPIESRCQIGSASIRILINKKISVKLLQLNLINPIHDGKSFTARSEHPTRDWA